jgi:hypothetical protein
MYCRFIVQLGVVVISSLSLSCGGDDNSADCTGNLCPFVGTWQLNEVAVDGSDVPGNYDDYILDLASPTTDPSLAEFARHYTDGEDQAGTWTVTNNNNVLVLSADGEDEEYIVETITSDQLILVLERESNKPGPSQIRMGFTQ